MRKEEYPYAECENCKDLGDCRHPDVQVDGMGSVLPPDCCPKPIDVMKEAVKKRKNIRTKSN